MNKILPKQLLKSRLQTLRSKEFDLEKEESVTDYIESMLQNIGTVDSELRDDLIYSAFAKWITDGQLSADDMLHIKNTILDQDHLFYRIGEQGTDSVFTRSFSILLIPVLLEQNNHKAFMQQSDLTVIKEKILLYMKQETDWRGFVAHKGWAHALAHTADSIHAISIYTDLTMNERMQFLDAIKDSVCTKHTVYTHLEEERLVTAVVSLLDQNHLYEMEIQKWIGTFLIWNKTNVWNEEYKIVFNIKSFLGSLYFRIHQQTEWAYTAGIIEERIHELMQDYIN